MCVCDAVGTAIAIATVVILVLRFCITAFAIHDKGWDNKYIEQFVRYFIIGVTVLVVAVPEGLPLAVTLALAYSVRVRVTRGFLYIYFNRYSVSQKRDLYTFAHNFGDFDGLSKFFHS